MVYQFYIVEITQYPNGEYEHNVEFRYDTDKDLAKRKAESRAHELLTAAALSNTAKHSVTVLSDECYQGLTGRYQNQPLDPAPEPEE